jgi:hypothetical protein
MPREESDFGTAQRLQRRAAGEGEITGRRDALLGSNRLSDGTPPEQDEIN